MRYPRAIQDLITHFNQLPGVGPKTALRYAFFVLRNPTEFAQKFAAAIAVIHKATELCGVCYGIDERSPCTICSDPRRDRATLCVVADDQDRHAIETTNEYHGLYHVLGGVLAPLEGMTPETLRIKELLARIGAQKPKEIILAFNPDMDGEGTMLALARILKPQGVRISRLARGLPIGADLEYADQVTLGDALRGRREL
ncbi:MAG: recombination mediator RecR [Patescibacteria group bacterium]